MGRKFSTARFALKMVRKISSELNPSEAKPAAASRIPGGPDNGDGRSDQGHGCAGGDVGMDGEFAARLAAVVHADEDVDVLIGEFLYERDGTAHADGGAGGVDDEGRVFGGVAQDEDGTVDKGARDFGAGTGDVGADGQPDQGGKHKREELEP